MYKSIIATIVLALVACNIATAQVQTYGFNYVIGVPTGNKADFISDASYRGASFEFTYVPDDAFGLHFEAGWNHFYESLPKGTYEFGTLAITGKQYRYSTSVPILVGINYFILPEAVIIPYVAFGAGLMYTENTLEAGLYSISREAWQFAVKPELGVAIQLTDGLYGKVSAKYYQTIKTEDVKGQSFLGVNMGLAFLVQ